MSGLDDLLRRAAAAQRGAMERALAPLRVTPAQFALLRIVLEKPGISGADVARLERLSPPTISVIVANLERRGALTRHRAAKNARVHALEVTPLGVELARGGVEAAEAIRRRIEGPAPREALSAIASWLHAVADIEV